MKNSNLEFKKARNRFSYRKLKNYCSALANEVVGFLSLRVKMTLVFLSEQLPIQIYNDMQIAFIC